MDGIRTRINSFWRPATFRLAHHCMVRAEGFEPSTFRLWADYSNHWVTPASFHRESGGGKTRTCVSLFMFIGFCKYFCPYTDKFHNGTNDIYLKHFFPIKLHHHPHDEGIILSMWRTTLALHLLAYAKNFLYKNFVFLYFHLLL